MAGAGPAGHADEEVGQAHRPRRRVQLHPHLALAQ